MEEEVSEIEGVRRQTANGTEGMKTGSISEPRSSAKQLVHVLLGPKSRWAAWLVVRGPSPGPA